MKVWSLGGGDDDSACHGDAGSFGEKEDGATDGDEDGMITTAMATLMVEEREPDDR